MATDEQAESKERGVRPAEGISHFLAKVLDQLSLTAWLPAVVLVAASTLMVALHHKRNLDIGGALAPIAHAKPIGLFVGMLFAVVVAAVLTQAFAFELIRLLEGYWGKSKPMLYASSLAVWRHKKRAEDARAKLKQRRDAALDSACKALQKEGFTSTHINLIRWQEAGAERSERPASKRADRRLAAGIPWRRYASPALLESEDLWRKRTEDYPYPHRILPTRLGNALRAREDQLEQYDEEDLEGLVMRRYESIPPRLMTRHDQFRDRLEMYYVLVIVFVALGIAAVPLLAPCAPSSKGIARHTASAAAFLLYMALAGVSYTAAVASARAYGRVLLEIAKRPVDRQPSPSLVIQRLSLMRRTTSWFASRP